MKLTKNWRNKKSKEPAYIEIETNTFVKVYLSENQGEENGDFDQAMIFSKKRFLEEYEEVKDEQN